MAEEVGIPQQKKGLSKGCLISLIVVGVIVILIVVMMVMCYVYREDLMKTGTAAALTSIKSELADNPPAGIDTAQFNALTDDFISTMNADTAEVDLMQFQSFMQSIQTMLADKAVDSSEVEDLKAAMIRYYPELGERYEQSPEFETEAGDTATDTTSY